MATLKKTVFDSTIKTAAEAMEVAGLTWIAEQSEVMNVATSKISTIKKSIYRSDNQNELGVVGLSYTPLQCSDTFAFFDIICERYGAKYKYASEINGGSKVILYAEIEGAIAIKKGDDVRKGFILTNGFDGITAAETSFMVERLICTNGLRALVKDASSKVSIRHTKSIHDKIQEALEVFTHSVEYFTKFEEQAKFLAQKMVDKNMVEKFLQKVVGESESKRTVTIKENITALFENGKGNHGETAWDLYNGLTEYVDHFKGKNNENREISSLIGSGVDLKEYAFDVAMKI
jgi:phage/plasmid-like protein (TIGR03299 family)